ncbi:amino acid transporter-like protein [Mollisia scopiformis]|uniref:Amino acid transporter-like protein n=1 Tax=Mollisia scopiformis TaxID=149040 RepID=A0A194XRU1_MOLSC|nr:amino acid transporter-like protein [Mollisia scopiformis]KUJ22442.1 amino acid transporter-like protein [Mollisia scopiformis]
MDIKHVTEDYPSDEKAVPRYDVSTSEDGIIVENVDDLQRKLSGRQIQMITIGGSIGTALFVSIGSGLIQGGPGSLLIAFVMYCVWLAAVNNCMAEMAVFMPVSGSFIRMGSKWIDESFGFMLGWNFFLYEAVLIPWEISALNLVLTFWRDDIPLAAVCAGCIVLYGIINLFAVKWYGESEFWLSSGKLALIIMLFCFTFITMVGGNPKHDAYGFRYWREPGAFAEYVTTGTLGRFEGFLAALWKAAFTIVGPEYIAMMAGEASHPRKNLKRAFKTIYLRFGLFFIGGALACGIVIPYTDPTLNSILSGDSSASGTAASSPYVIAMQNLGIGVLPHITNALLVTSIFSAGNSYVYCASRTLYSLSLDGHAPRFLQKCTKKGVPIWCFCVTMIFPFLSFLAVGTSSAQVITWLANLTEASQIIDYICMCWIYLYFYRALKVQGFDRKDLPYVGLAQPYCAWFGLATMTFTVIMYGYATFLPGWWDVGTFFSYYTMCFVCPILYVGWKVVKKTKMIPPEEADLVWERPVIDAYEANTLEPHMTFWEECKMMMGWKKKEEHIHSA